MVARIEEVERGYWTVFSEDGNETYYCGMSKDECIKWCRDRSIEIYEEV